MNKVDKNRPVSSIRHDDERAAIPDSAHQGEEQMAISGMTYSIIQRYKKDFNNRSLIVKMLQ